MSCGLDFPGPALTIFAQGEVLFQFCLVNGYIKLLGS